MWHPGQYEASRESFNGGAKAEVSHLFLFEVLSINRWVTYTAIVTTISRRPLAGTRTFQRGNIRIPWIQALFRTYSTTANRSVRS